ncbi:MAG: hypothetical protein IT385_29400 [Deltaproteobacteria bacterium]|nr:hypothetical protein [Deltaproteobacteria bacterium]
MIRRRARHLTLAGALALSTPLGIAARAAEPPPQPSPPPGDETIPQGIADRIIQAEAAFRVQNYPRVIQLLDPLVGHPKLEGRPEHVKVLEWLAASHWFTSSHDASRLAFGQLLRESPFHRLDEFVYPEPLITFFEDRRRELVQANIIPERPGPGPDPVAPRELVLRTTTLYEAPTIAYLMPFGVGQYANDEDGKGTAFAVIHGVTAAVMLTTWIGIETLKVDGSDDIVIGQGDREAKLLNGLFIGAFGVFVASWAWSIADGLASRRDPTTKEERVRLLPGDVPPETTGGDDDPPVRAFLSPGPGSLGLGLGLSF